MNDEIRVLTYNLCWGCMASDERSSNDKTAGKLAMKCYELNKTRRRNVCYENIQKTIDDAINNQNILFDFIATQESEININNITSRYLKVMGYVQHTLAYYNKSNVKMITFYNNSRFKLLGATVGDLLYKNETGRPYQILYFKRKYSQKRYIFINLHSPHLNRMNKKLNYKSLTSQLSKNINMGHYPNLNKYDKLDIYIENNEYFPKQKNISNILVHYRVIDKKRQPYVIMTGDFNDHRNNYWKKINPFKDTKLYNFHKIEVKSPKRPPKSCCSTKRKSLKSKQDNYVCDYILSNEKFEVFIPSRILITFNANSNNFPTSDHMPVEAMFVDNKDG